MEWTTQLDLLWSVFAALGVGALIGLEREYRGFEAGLRTSAMVCAGAAVFAGLGAAYGDSRVAASVVQGIGFIGAGLIFQRKATVHNLTTAATMWSLAGVGMLMALDLWIVGLGAALALLLVLEMQPLSRFVYQKGDRTAERRDQLKGDTIEDEDEDEYEDDDEEPEAVRKRKGRARSAA